MSQEIIPNERVVRSIRWIRGQKVLLDSDLATLYGVTTGNLNKAVKRNAERFPSDFMFQLKPKEIATVLEAIRQLMATPEKPRREIGFHVREKSPRYRARERA